MAELSSIPVDSVQLLVIEYVMAKCTSFAKLALNDIESNYVESTISRPNNMYLSYILMYLFISSDPAMKQLLLHLDETNALGKKFVIQDLDETHMFIASDILATLHARIDGLMDKLHFPVNQA